MQNKPAFVVSAVVSLFMALLAVMAPACNPSDEEGADSACAINSDCSGGEVCKWERCLDFCVTSSDCPSDKYCHGAGVCTDCALDENCPEGKYCLNGACVAEDQIEYGQSCKSDFDCGKGQICYNQSECRLTCQADLDCESPYKYCNSDGVCSICIEDAHCQAGQTCENEKCVGSPDTDGDAETETDSVEEDTIVEPDGWPGDACGEALPQCRESGECFNFGEASVCTHDCTSSTECIFDISGGCCLKIDEIKSVCSPYDYCPDIGIDGRPCTANEGCLESNLKCLKDAQGTNFCSRNCVEDSDCPSGSYPNGCCRQIGENSWCVLGEFCN